MKGRNRKRVLNWSRLKKGAAFLCKCGVGKARLSRDLITMEGDYCEEGGRGGGDCR